MTYVTFFFDGFRRSHAHKGRFYFIYVRQIEEHIIESFNTSFELNELKEIKKRKFHLCTTLARQCQCLVVLV